MGFLMATLPDSLAFASIEELGKQWRAGKFSAVELAEFFLDRLRQWGPAYNAVVTLTPELAKRQAQVADAELAAGKDRGPLFGIPYGAKDLLDTQGIATTWGAGALRNRVPERDATVIAKLGQAGAVLVAKLAMVECAGGLGYQQANASFTGPALNPWNTDRWAGGSSSGSGAAVAAGLIPFAIGSETWGSITAPAAYCGITGLRPTYGRVSRHGAMALSWTMDKIGPMARSARDCGLILSTIAGADPHDPTSVSQSYEFPPRTPISPPFRFAVVKDVAKGLQKEVAKNYKFSLKLLAQSGSIEEIELPDFPHNEVAGLVVSCEMASAFEELMTSKAIWEMTAEEDRWGAFGPQVIPAVAYLRAMRVRTLIQREMDKLLAKYDALVTPTEETVAPPVGQRFSGYGRGFFNCEASAAGNVSGLPSISLPNGFGESHLPTALNLLGRAFEENRLLSIAEMLQGKTDWHAQRPPLAEKPQ
jgi:aspartyl-tRNA(Asn)/glutamyl-tRNA(Gln) amidotransferase subunit A